MVDKLFNVKYLPLFHHFKAIYQIPKHIIFWVKIVANASLRIKPLKKLSYLRHKIDTICTNIYFLSGSSKFYTLFNLFKSHLNQICYYTKINEFECDHVEMLIHF